MRLQVCSNGRLTTGGDHFGQVGIWKPFPNYVSVRVSSKWRAVENRTAETILYVFLAPGVGNDMVIVEVAVLRNITRHPISRALEHK